MRLIHSLFIAGLLMLTAGAVHAQTPATTDPVYGLREEWTGPCRRAAVVDVNLGNAPEAFVRAASCQISGLPLYPESETHWADALRNDPKTRRVDVVLALCRQAGRVCKLGWSDPWTYGAQGDAVTCHALFHRDIGAVVMFFFHCPQQVNCQSSWANNHVRGMTARDGSLSWGTQSTGWYNGGNPGFWRQQLQDAKRAGLQYIVPNLYGPDMAQVDNLVLALQAEPDPVRVGLFDDSWAWGKAGSGGVWARAPDLGNTEAAARTLYDNKWKPYFSKIPAADWYRIDGRPVIYVYNAGTLKPLSKSAAVLARMKALFAADFGVTPYLAVDDAFFADPAMTDVADTRFRWDTLAGDFHAPDGSVAVDDGLSRSNLHGRTMANAMVRWDSFGRDGGKGPFRDRRIKDGAVLGDVLARSQDVDNLLLETWNDLGEGTGISAAYDYYDHGQWQRPDVFMQMIRKANCDN